MFLVPVMSMAGPFFRAESQPDQFDTSMNGEGGKNVLRQTPRRLNQLIDVRIYLPVRRLIASSHSCHAALTGTYIITRIG